MASVSEPHRERPYTPQYGIPDTLDGTLPWSWAVERLSAALIYWMATTRPDGSPHLRPTWAGWADGALWFEGGLETRWARNLARSPSCTMSVERDADVVMVEGHAEMLRDPDPAIAGRIVAAYGKYVPSHDYRVDPANWREGGLWRLRPLIAFGWGRAYPADATRWRFG
jgi:nitroimidazol reductase NimA-like FMN-containing flavoprotein (pyridoxamine 5'-phosphate oxidase superfamily)